MEGADPWDGSTEMRGGEVDGSEGQGPARPEAQKAEQEAPPPAEPLVRLRCVDRTHSPGCTWYAQSKSASDC